ncbi:hypothetical protein GJ496_000373, partial [Pomphorhynchus laevis]
MKCDVDDCSTHNHETVLKRKLSCFDDDLYLSDSPGTEKRVCKENDGTSPPNCCVRTLERFYKQFQAEIANYTSSFIQQALWFLPQATLTQAPINAPNLFHQLPHLISNAVAAQQFANDSQNIQNPFVISSFNDQKLYEIRNRKRKAKVTDGQIRCKIRRSEDVIYKMGDKLSPENVHCRTETSITSNELADKKCCLVLTSCHLRKAKLMFLYTRYPNSQTIRECFSDVYFTKSNTSQLIKWFSNFREYFYIQIEKHVRAHLDDSGSCEAANADINLFRILTSHYDRTNQIQ